MGYAQAAGLPAICGLYATIVPIFVYALFGPSRILVLGPDSSLAALIAATVIPLAAGSADRAIELAGMLALLSGALCVAAGLARFGFLTELLSKPIRYGYINGIALTVVVGQLPRPAGLQGRRRRFTGAGEGAGRRRARRAGQLRGARHRRGRTGRDFRLPALDAARAGRVAGRQSSRRSWSACSNSPSEPGSR